jgi:predicted aldo/keto reductase-like oxidoreductase
MKYRKMGRLPWEVSALGFGSMRLPYKGKIILNVKESIRMIRRGIDLGINYIDTAYMYSLFKSENVVGEALKDGYRQKVHLVTKLPTMMVRNEDDFDKYLHKQLEKLDDKYLDVYLFHHLTQSELEKVKRLNLLKKMEKAKEEGLIGAVGFSFHDTLPAFRNVVDSYNWDVAQIQYNYLDTGIQAGTEGLKYAAEKGLAVVIMEPLKGGYLANPPKEAMNIINHAPVKRTPVDWGLQFLWNLPEISVVLSGMSTMKQVEENCEYADKSGVNSLNSEDLHVIDQLAEITRRNILVPCTACKYCMPCPSGVNIPQNFALLNNCAVQYGSMQNKVLQLMIKRRYSKLADSKIKLQDAPNMGNASLCVKCKLCIPKCPQHIAIPDELEKVNAILGKGKKIEDLYDQK